jgi:ribose transport system ATP-binding protein
MADLADNGDESRGTAATAVPLLRVHALSKTFPGLRALDDVSLTVSNGEIVALLGQNGSGKSTLVKVLAGVYEPDPGASIDAYNEHGDQLTASETREALHFIHQDLGLIPTLSTVENLDLGRPLHGRGFVPIRQADEVARAQAIIRPFGISIDVTAPIARLAPAERAVVAIARALDGWARPDNVLVLDEPTAALHASESGVLLAAVRQVAANGAGVIYISHRLDEVMALADRVVVLRGGRVVADEPTKGLAIDRLVRLVAGRDVAAQASGREPPRGEPVLTVAGLAGDTVLDASFEVRAGEIVGVSGTIGSGRERIGAVLFGDCRGARGTVRVDGHELAARDPAVAIRAGMAYVPGDRVGHAIVGTMSMVENLTLPAPSRHQGRLGHLKSSAEREEAKEWIARIEVRPPDPDKAITLFSGGNQQKVVLAKWLRNRPRVLILDDPTQGVDVGAKDTIYSLIRSAAAQGAAVLVGSSDDKELADICDRVLVMRSGRVSAELAGGQLSEERILRESYEWIQDVELI